MLKSYSRRAFLLLALFALEPAYASPPSKNDGPTLWDVLSKTETPVVPGNGAGRQSLVMVRRPLGPIPGITLAGTDVAGSRKHGGFFGRLGDMFGMLESKTGSKIKATGQFTETAQLQNISGSPSAFQSDQYLGRGGNGIYTDEDLTVDATLFKWFHYATRISNSLMKNPNDNRVLMDYKPSSKLRVQYGDINVSFTGNSLVDFSRYLHGIQVYREWTPKLATTMLYAETKATTQTIVINGNNSSGPYYVYAGEIVDGSAQVRLDNQVLQPGTDYTLDTYSGQLNFLKNRIILQSDTIAVSFESLGAVGSQGSIYGMKVDTQPRKGWSIGAVYVAQSAPGSGVAGQLTEQFLGENQPNFYVTSQPIDQSKPMVVSVGGLLLSPGQYSLDTTTLYTNRIYIKVSVPSTTIVQIQYFPYNPSPIPGSRSVMGLETKYTMGRFGTITLESAMSGLSISNQNVNGTAYTGRADLTPLRNLHTALTVKDVSPTFSSIQSPGFTQNEKSIDLATDYSPTKRLKLNLDLELAHRPSYSGTTEETVSTIGSDHFHQISGGAQYALGKNSNLNFTASDITTNYAVGGSSNTKTEALTYSETIKKVGVDFSLNSNTSSVATSAGLLGGTTTGAGSLFTSDSSSYGGRVGLHWQANKSLNFQSSVSVNKIKSESDGTSTGSTASDGQISATFNGVKHVRLSYSMDLSDTGSSAINSVGSGGTIVTPVTGTTAPGTLAGGGINSGLGGFGNQNNVVNSSLGYTSFGGKSLSNRIQMEITPRKDMQLGLNLSKSSSLGNYQYNSNSTTAGANFSWQLSDKMQLTGNYSLQQLVYTGSFGGSTNHSAMFSFQGRPFGGRLGVQFGYQLMQTQSAFSSSSPSSSDTSGSSPLTNTSNNLTSMTARLDYPISSKETLFVEMLNSVSTGYLANTENDVRFGMDYALTRVLKFSFGWQILRHNYSDPSESDLNYKASNLLAQFGVHF